jgi:hypothetical protein
MPLLLERMKDINAHWDALRGDFQSFLRPENGAYYIDKDESAPGTATLKSRNFPDEVAERFGGTVVPVVLFLSDHANEQPWFWLGWHEEWGIPSSSRSGKRLQFRSSAVTVYLGIRGNAKRQLLRAEWAGAEELIDGRYVFPASGSAHPHWHVDGIRGYLNDVSRSWDRLISERNAARDLAVDRVREFGDEHAQQDIAGLFTLPPVSLPGPSDLAWTEIHLAACARWAEQPWPGPGGPHDTHASNPENCQQLRLWLTSCVRYLQAEIEDKLLRGRY